MATRDARLEVTNYVSQTKSGSSLRLVLTELKKQHYRFYWYKDESLAGKDFLGFSKQPGTGLAIEKGENLFACSDLVDDQERIKRALCRAGLGLKILERHEDGKIRIAKKAVPDSETATPEGSTPQSIP